MWMVRWVWWMRVDGGAGGMGRGDAGRQTKGRGERLLSPACCQVEGLWTGHPPEADCVRMSVS